MGASRAFLRPTPGFILEGAIEIALLDLLAAIDDH